MITIRRSLFISSLIPAEDHHRNKGITSSTMVMNFVNKRLTTSTIIMIKHEVWSYTGTEKNRVLISAAYL